MLTSQIQNIFGKGLDNINEIANEICQAYVTYCRQALGPLGEPVVLKGTETALLSVALINLMAAKLPAGPASQAIGTGVSAFWLLPPVLTAAGGVSTSILPAAGIAKLRNTKVDTIQKGAKALADSLHMMTKTVLITEVFPAPPGFLI